MQHRQLLLATAAILALSAGAASAQVTPGWYVGAGAGVTQLRDGDVGGQGKAEYDPGYAILGALGYQFGDFRLELEPGYRRSGVDKFSNGGGSASGDISALSGMLNIYHDFMPESRFNPYLGVGAGYARVTADNISRNGVRVADGSDGTFAFQGIAGLTYAFTQNLALDVAYRYFDAQDAKIGGNDLDFKSHTLTAGLVWRFGAPPPPAPMAQPAAAPAPAPVARPAPPPAPTPAPPPAAALPNVYIVFFAFDKADITPVAAQVLDRAIADFRSTGSTGIRIEGHTDRAGSDKYNLALSKRRADAVKAYLTSKGVGAGAIAEEAFGESKPRVATPDGARNDENRRAEIYLRK